MFSGIFSESIVSSEELTIIGQILPTPFCLLFCLFVFVLFSLLSRALF